MSEEKIMYAGENILGKRYRMLTVKKEACKKGRHRMVECLCDCGKQTVVFITNIVSDRSKSCGCLHSEFIYKHRYTSHNYISPEYNAWCSIRHKCNNVNDRQYKNYGAKGIKVCKRWNSEDGFIRFIHDMGDKPSPFYHLARIDKNKDYTPENCKWEMGNNRYSE